MPLSSNPRILGLHAKATHCQSEVEHLRCTIMRYSVMWWLYVELVFAFPLDTLGINPKAKFGWNGDAALLAVRIDAKRLDTSADTLGSPELEDRPAT